MAKPPKKKAPVTRQNAASVREILRGLGEGWGKAARDIGAS